MTSIHLAYWSSVVALPKAGNFFCKRILDQVMYKDLIHANLQKDSYDLEPKSGTWLYKHV